LYYEHLGNDDPSKIDELRSEAENQGIELSPSTIKLLGDSKHARHMRAITARKDKKWNHDFVKQRTERISEIVWDCISPWLSK